MTVKKMLLVGLVLLLIAPSFVVSSTARLLPKDTSVEGPSTAHEAHEHRGLADVDVRRDPETRVLNGASALVGKYAPVDRTVALDALVAEAPLRSPDSLAVELHDSGIPKSVANLDGFLTDARTGSPDAIAREFLTHHTELFGLAPDEVRNLRITMDNLDETTGVTYLKYEQTVGGVPVFDSEIGITITARGEVVIVNQGQTLPGAVVSTDAAIAPDEAVARAFAHCGVEVLADAVRPSAAKRGDASAFTYYENPLGEGREEVAFQKTVVNVAGEAVLAYRAYVDKSDEEWYDTLVDANTGELLVRSNIVHDVAGQVFKRSPNFSRTTEQFAPLFGVTRPWLSGTLTTGNNVDAYLDRDMNDQPDATTTGSGASANAGLTNGRADASKGSPVGQFTFAYTEGAAPTSHQAAAVANLFYFNNYMHDWMYSLGFTESARNFQTNNFGLGGAQNDAVLAEAQDGSGTNNANFATPPDGQRPRMQQYLFTGNRDSDLDGDVVFHEYGHGVSNRLIGNGSGLGGAQSRAMGEGWSDYWACSNYDDGAMGEYVIGRPTGIRRAAYSVPAATIRDSYADVGNQGFQVHRDGEIWAATLWDLNRTIGKAKADKIILDGMKNTPTSPSMVSARTGIVTACNTLYPADLCAVWRVFARHGLGLSATGNDGTTHNAASDLPVSCGGTPPCSPSSSPISLGQTLSGSLATTDCTTTAGDGSHGAFYDTFTFPGTSGQQVTITLNASTFDAFLRLKNSGGAVVASDDDGNAGTNSKITYTLTASGSFTIEATSFYLGKVGAYTVSLTSSSSCTSGTLGWEGDEVFLPSYTTTTSGTHTGTISTPEDVNYYCDLQKWNGSAWVTVAASPLSAQSVSYNGTPGQYRWRVWSFFNGGYGFNFCSTRPT